MWKAIAKLIRVHAQTSEAASLTSEVQRLQSELAYRDEVAIPALRRELELEKRTNEMYAARIEQEVRRVEAETYQIAGRIAEGQM